VELVLALLWFCQKKYLHTQILPLCTFFQTTHLNILCASELSDLSLVPIALGLMALNLMGFSCPPHPLMFPYVRNCYS
jgi:hypothetical protein